MLFASLAVAGSGGLLANWIGISGGWLLGAIASIVCARAMGFAAALPLWLRALGMGFAGITVGSAVTRETLALAALLPLTLIAMFVYLAVLIAVIVFLHRHYWHASRATALASAWPGNVLLVFISAEASRANMQQVAVVQSVRVLALMGLLPMTIGLYQASLPTAAATGSGYDLAIAVAIALACIFAARRLRLVGGEMFLTAFAVGALSGAGLLHIAMPRPAIGFFQVVVGGFVGMELARSEARAFLAALKPAVATALFAALSTIAAAFALAPLIDYPAAALALALAPGGAEAMILLSVVFGVDPAFVGIHHTIRLVALTLGLPLALRWAAHADYQATGKR